MCPKVWNSLARGFHVPCCHPSLKIKRPFSRSATPISKSVVIQGEHDGTTVTPKKKRQTAGWGHYSSLTPEHAELRGSKLREGLCVTLACPGRLTAQKNTGRVEPGRPRAAPRVRV